MKNLEEIASRHSPGKVSNSAITLTFSILLILRGILILIITIMVRYSVKTRVFLQSAIAHSNISSQTDVAPYCTREVSIYQ